MGDLGALDCFPPMVFTENDTTSLAETLPTSDEADTPALFSSGPSSADSFSGSRLLPLDITGDTILDSDNDLDAAFPQCGCSSWAAGLAKLFHTGTSAGLSPSSAASTPTRRIQSAISRNKKATDRIEVILQCSFPHDTYLLVMLSMVLLRVMDNYGDAVRKNYNYDREINKYHGSADDTGLGRPWAPPTQWPGEGDKGRSACGLGSDGADSARCSVHLILGELHRPQRLVSQISGLIRAEEARSSGGHEASGSSRSWVSGTSKAGSMGGGSLSPLSPFSDVLLRQLGVDLRRRLQKLSLEVRHALRRE